MITLGIETSGRAGSIALRVNGELRSIVELTANGRRHARTLVPEVGQLLKSHSISPKQVELLAVSIGPGSFTGLRVGVVCAKTFAYAVGCPLIGVDTFLAVAARQADPERCWVIEDALRGDLCAGEYQQVNGVWKNINPPRLVPFETWKSQLERDVSISGPGLDQWADCLEQFRLAPELQRNPCASAVALQGEQLASAGVVSDPWKLEPFYMRRSAAEEKADASASPEAN